MAAERSTTAIPAGALDAASISDVERRTLERIVARFRDELGDDLQAIWLYGSRARGEEPRPYSDIDLMVIVNGGGERYSRMAHDIAYDIAESEGAEPFLLSVFVDDPEWLRGRREIRSFFIQEVDRDKIVLYGSGL